MKAYRKWVIGLVNAFLVTSMLSGCAVFSFLDLATAGNESKQKSLSERVTKFHRELYWGTGSGYMEYIEASARSDMSRKLRQASVIEKLVDLEVRDIVLDENNSDLASVDVKVRFYKKASLNVSERFEKETWEYFRLRGGWFLKDREIAPNDVLPSDETEDGEKAPVG